MQAIHFIESRHFVLNRAKQLVAVDTVTARYDRGLEFLDQYQCERVAALVKTGMTETHAEHIVLAGDSDGDPTAWNYPNRAAAMKALNGHRHAVVAR